ncbi:zinc-binding protein A33-like [Clarias gariepinus]
MADSLEDDLSCPVCCEIFQDPQLLSCGHTFCSQCLQKHWTVNTRTCPVCRRVSLQEPVANLALRNTSETYQKEKERQKKESGSEVRCSQHGEKVKFFCKTDEEVICSKCRKESHKSHRVQLLTWTARQHKDRTKVALCPAESILDSLQNGTAQECKVVKYIEYQAKQTEKKMKKEFEKLHQFLREEEEAMRAALREEKEEKNYGYIPWVQGRLSDSQLSSGSLINVAKHVGNLRFRVWEKMKDLCPYYPVVLDPNSAHVSVSDDLVCVSRSGPKSYSPSPLHSNTNLLVLGSEAQNSSVSCWDVEVGDSNHWTLGVCRRSVAERNITQPLTPQNGFWGLCRNGNCYNALGSAPGWLMRHPETMRVKLVKYHDMNNWRFYWMLKFLDASSESEIACIRDIALESDLVPFLIPEDRNAPLRIVPVNVNMTKENKFSFFEKHMHMLHLYVIGLFLLLFVIMLPKK